MSVKISLRKAFDEVFEEVGMGNISKPEFLVRYEYIGGEVKHEVEVYLFIPGAGEENLSPNSVNEGGFTIKEAVWMEMDEAIAKLNFEDEKRLILKANEKMSDH